MMADTIPAEPVKRKRGRPRKERPGDRDQGSVPAGLTSTVTPGGILANDPEAMPPLAESLDVKLPKGSDWTARIDLYACVPSGWRAYGEVRSPNGLVYYKDEGPVPTHDDRLAIVAAAVDRMLAEIDSSPHFAKIRGAIRSWHIAWEKQERAPIAAVEALPTADPAVQQALAGVGEHLLSIDVTSIEWHPDNPRQTFDEAELRQLGATLERVGTLQPIVVRPHPHPHANVRWQGLAGERRWRAAQLVGMVSIAATARDVDDATALDIVVTENFARKDLNAIEQARAIAALTRPRQEQGAGLTQREVAERYGHKQSWAANLLRLLQLPEAIQAKVISGDIDQATARQLLPYAHVPEILARVPKHMKEQPYGWNRGDVGEAMTNLIEDVGVALDEHDLKKVAKLSEADRDKLRIVEVPLQEYYQDKPVKRLVALNIEYWEELRNAEAATREAKEDKKKKKEKARAPSPAETKAKEKDKAQALGERLKNWRRRWLRFVLAEKCDSVAVAAWQMKALLYLKGAHGSSCREYLQAAARALGVKADSYAPVWSIVKRVEDHYQLACAALRAALWPAHAKHRLENSHGLDDIAHGIIDELAADAGVDVEQWWNLIQTPAVSDEGGEEDNAHYRERFREFLELHTKDQLLRQAEAWGIDVTGAATKPAIVEHLFAWPHDLAIPACLAPAKKAKKRGRPKKGAKR